MRRLFVRNLHINSLLSFLLIGISLSSCQTIAIYNYEGMVAPKVIIPSDVKTMAFVDRNLRYMQDTVGMYYMDYYKINKDTVIYDDMMAEQVYQGFDHSKSELLAIDTLPFYSLDKVDLKGRRLYQPLQWSTVDSLCSINNSDILISLEDIQIYTKYSTMEIEYGQMAFVDINYFAVWRIYDPLLKKYIDERVIADSLFLEEQGGSFRALRKIENIKRKKIIKDIAYYVGEQYAQYLSPSWQKMERKYFVSGSSEFDVANYYVQKDDFDSAILIWEKLTRSDDLKIAARACFNMAFAMELQGKFKQAEAWLNQSQEHYKRLSKPAVEYKYLQDYKKELTSRFQNNYRLEKFFGKE